MFTNRPAMKKEATPRVNNEQEDFTKHEREFYHVRDQVQKRLLAKSEGELSYKDTNKVKQLIEISMSEALDEENILLNRNLREKYLEYLLTFMEPILQKPVI